MQLRFHFLFSYAANPCGALSPVFRTKLGFPLQYLRILTKRASISCFAGSRIFMTIPQNKVNIVIHINMLNFILSIVQVIIPSILYQKSSDNTNRSKGCSTSENAIKRANSYIHMCSRQQRNNPRMSSSNRTSILK